MAVKYLLIAQDLRNFILSQKSATTYRLPTEHEMCEKYKTSRQTIRQALTLLEEENLIIRIQGSGAYILPHADYLRKVKIVLLIAEENEYIYPSLISDISSVLSEKNLRIDVKCTHNDVNIERQILKQLAIEHVSLLIVEGVHTAFPNPNIDLYKSLHATKTEIMFIGNNYPELTNVGCVQINEIHGGYLLGKQMIMKNKHKVWAILPDYTQNAKERFFGFMSAYREKGLPIPAQNISWYSQQNMQNLYQQNDSGFLTDFVKQHAAKCNGVFCYNDTIAYYLIRELVRAKISVPDQISVCSFDNSPLCTLSKPAISSLSLPEHEPGYSIAKMIGSFLYKKDYDSTVTLTWKYVARDSL